MQRFVINVDSEKPEYEQLIPVVARAAEITLAAEGSQDRSSINILLTGDKRLQELNRRFLGDNSPTDVLSFPFNEVVEGLGVHLGDIAISMERVRQQAQKNGHSIESELQLLVVHGVLHLRGYDHDQPENKQTMWSRQAAILRNLSAEILLPLEDNHD